jgi:hypothetical protein
VTAGAGGNLSAQDAWQQNWNIVPLSDANTLRNLRALYRYVIYPNASLQVEYTVARVDKGGKFIKDPYALAEPQCVLCGPDLSVNPRLRRGWLYWTNSSGPGWAENPPPANVPLVDLGVYGGHRLYMTERDYASGYLADFVLFLMPVAPLGTVSTKPGTGKEGRAAPVNRAPFGITPSPNVPGIIQ